MLVISANSGIVPMTQEHLGYAIALEVPFFIIMTKVRFLNGSGQVKPNLFRVGEEEFAIILLYLMIGVIFNILYNFLRLSLP